MPVTRAVWVAEVMPGVRESVRRGREKGEPARAPPFPDDVAADALGDLHAARRALDLAGTEAAGADLHLDDLVARGDARDLEVRLPGTTRLVVRVAHIVAVGDALVADVAAVALNGHRSALHQFDARHLSPVTL